MLQVNDSKKTQQTQFEENEAYVQTCHGGECDALHMEGLKLCLEVLFVRRRTFRSRGKHQTWKKEHRGIATHCAFLFSRLWIVWAENWGG